MSGFNTTRLAGARVLVSGSEPEEKTILDASEWDNVKHVLAHKAAQDFYDTKIAEHFAPLTDAADAAMSIIENATPKEDDVFKVVIEPGVEKVKGQPEVAMNLGHDAAVLQIIESGNISRLIWIGSTIEITA